MFLKSNNKNQILKQILAQFSDHVLNSYTYLITDLEILFALKLKNIFLIFKAYKLYSSDCYTTRAKKVCFNVN